MDNNSIFAFIPRDPFDWKHQLSRSLSAGYLSGALIGPLGKTLIGDAWPWLARASEIAWCLGVGILVALLTALFGLLFKRRFQRIEELSEPAWRRRITQHQVWVIIFGIVFVLCLLILGDLLKHQHLRVFSGILPFVLLGVLLPWALVNYDAWIHLERLCVRQRDMALQARLAPHFLHGALSTLKGQILEDPLEAQAMVDQLARLSREAMALTAERHVPLSRELAFVEAYLGVERARLGERLRVVIQVPEVLETELVPPMALQLLVENALRHGLPVEGGEIHIQAERNRMGFYLTVEDPGQGAGESIGLGQSLGILRRRLLDDSDLVLQRTPEGRHRASLRVSSSWE